MALGPHNRSPASRAARLAVGAALCAVGAWSGCSVEKHYEVLSFFFDGVPDPNAPKMQDGALDGRTLRQSPTYSAHDPFIEERCSDCHQSRFNLGPQDSGICLDCHENATTEQPRMHGPVVAVACLWCHSPHESPYASLLKGPARQVCTTCHEQSMLDTQRVPEHADAERSCLDCHYGHGGMSRYFLRGEASVAAPKEDPQRTHATPRPAREAPM